MNGGKITAIAIDDEEAAIQGLTIILNHFSDQIELIGSSTDFDSGLELVNRVKPDVLFLDIDIENNRSGFDFLKIIRLNNCTSRVVFITAHEQFGIKALREEAFDYLIKPIDRQDFKSLMDRLSANKPEKPRDFILINNKEALHKIYLEEILYIKAEGSYTEIYLTEKPRPIVTSYNLGVLDEEISKISNLFYRIHNSYIVNKSKIITVKKSLTSKKVVLENKLELPISRSRYTEFIAIFMNL